MSPWPQGRLELASGADANRNLETIQTNIGQTLKADLTQTLGIQTTKLRCCFECGGRLLAILLAIGYLSIPIAILAGYGSEYRKAALAALATHQ